VNYTLLDIAQHHTAAPRPPTTPTSLITPPTDSSPVHELMMRATSASPTSARPAGFSPSAPPLQLAALRLALLPAALPPFLLLLAAAAAAAAELRRCSERSLRMISPRRALRSCSALVV